jgi:hypothetical protein
MSIIAAGTTTTTALSSTGNTDGTLQLQVNGTTPSVTLNTLGAIGVGSTPAFGTSGQVLTSGGSTVAPAWATPATTSPAGSTGQVQYNNAGSFGAVALGTSTTVLHGNASGAPTFGAVALATDVSGTLPIANGGTNSTATATAGGAIYGTGAAYAVTAAGTSGQFLKSNGASAPTWATASAGALVFISSQTVSTAVASVDFTSGISSTYDDYVVYYENVTPGTSSRDLDLRLYKSGAFQTSSYSRANVSVQNTGTFTANNSSGQINLTDSGPATTTQVSGYVTLMNLNSTVANQAVVLGTSFVNSASSTSQSLFLVGSSQSTAAATTGFQFLFSSGTITAGTFRLYGIAKA